MHFVAEHRFAGSVHEVAALLVDPDFALALQLPDLASPEVLEHAPLSAAGGGTLRLRYEYTGSLDPIARMLLGGERLTWIQQLRLDPAGDSGSLELGAEQDPSRLHAHAGFTLRSDPDEGPSTTVRHLEGDLVVGVPLIGGPAERRIVPGVLARLDLEAESLARRLGKG